MAAPPAKSKPKGQILAAKEAKLFKELLRDFEDRTYKKGLKTAEAILKKSPENGETLCMKGIITYNTGKRPEGIELVKKGTRLDSGSHICWHVSALVWRAEKDLPQALKCYARAVEIDENQTNLVRDLVSLQLQLRHWPDCLDHRVHLLALQPKYRPHWTGLAVAYHLNKRYDEAIELLSRYEAMLADRPKHDYDFSELVLYHAMVLEESGQLENALQLLERRESEIVDKVGLQTHRARLLLSLGNKSAAEGAYRTLLKGNPENYAFIEGILKSRGCTLDSHSQGALEILDELLEKFPKSNSVRRLILDVAAGDTFRQRVSAYLVDSLTKGIPSLFVDLKSLYKDDEKRKIVEAVILNFRKGLDQSGRLTADYNQTETDSVDAPTTLVWVLYFLSQHYSILHHDQLAIDTINQVIQYTPTLPDLYMMKARFLKRGGDRIAALAAMEEARALDGQDRFLNGKSVKYTLRLNKTEEAEKIASLFTRDPTAPVSDLVDMQCLWFMQEEGDAHRRNGNIGMALKRYHQIEKTFNDWRDDEFDFHTWCLRKATIRHYIWLTRFEDQLRSHPGYFKAAQAAIEIYIELDSKKKNGLTNGNHENDADEQLRKAQKKAKKAEAKAKSQTNSKAAPVATSKKDDDEPPPQADDDPNGSKLASTSEPLVVASRLLAALQREAASRVETWLLSFDLAVQKGTHLAALKALRQAHAISADHPEVFLRLARFDTLFKNETSPLDAQTKEIYAKVKSELFPFDSIDAAVGNFLQKPTGSSAQGLLAAAKASAAPQQTDLVFQILHREVNCSADAAIQAVALLKQWQSPRLEEFQEKAAARFPLAVGKLGSVSNESAKAKEDLPVAALNKQVMQ